MEVITMHDFTNSNKSKKQNPKNSNHNPMAKLITNEALKHIKNAMTALQTGDALTSMKLLAIGTSLFEFHKLSYTPLITKKQINDDGKNIKAGKPINITVALIKNEIQAIEQYLNTL